MSRTYVPAELRRLIRNRASECCEYCLTPEAASFVPHEVDHIVAEKHGGPTTAENMALACALFNNAKASDLTSIDPQTGDIVPIFHPRRDQWTDHFRLADAEIIPLTPVGRVTVRLLQLNHPDRIVERELLISVNLIRPPAIAAVEINPLYET